MSDRYLLDTGVANLLAEKDAETLTRIAQIPQFHIPITVIGELYFGAYRYASLHQSTKYLDLYDAFQQQHRKAIIIPNIETAQLYAVIYAELTAKGQIIQQNDVWIAAHARQRGLTVATVDSDMLRVSGITVEMW